MDYHGHETQVLSYRDVLILLHPCPATKRYEKLTVYLIMETWSGNDKSAHGSKSIFLIFKEL